MTINIADFGDVLVFRPAGRDAIMGASAYLLNDANKYTNVLCTIIFILANNASCGMELCVAV